MKHAFEHLNKIYFCHQVNGLGTSCFQSASKKLVFPTFFKLVLKMTEKREPPLGAFRLNPFSVSGKEVSVPQTISSKKSYINKTNRGDKRMIEQATAESAPVETMSDSSELDNMSAETAGMMDSGIMMKMVVSGPPQQAKRQSVLPESLLQKVTNIVRQQTMTVSLNPNLPKKKETSSTSKTTENSAICEPGQGACEVETEGAHQFLESEKTELNKTSNNVANQDFSQPVADSTASSEDPNLCDSGNSNFNSEILNISDIQGLNETIEDDSSMHCVTCTSFNSTLETEESLTDKNSELNERTDSLDVSENIVKVSQHEMVRPPPDSNGETEEKELKDPVMQINAVETDIISRETEISLTCASEPLANLCVQEEGKDSVTLKYIKETITTTDSEIEMNPSINIQIEEGKGSSMIEKAEEETMVCTSDNKTDLFGGLFLETHPDNDKKVKKDKGTDEVYNLAPLFSGGLEKWRKRESNKEKKKALRKKQTEKFKKSVSEETGGEEKEDKERKKAVKPTPNYFVAIQITNPKIHAGIQRVQEDVVSGNEKLKPALNRLATLHLTMFVLHLKTEDDLERAKHAMDQCQKKLEPLYSNQLLTLDIGSLGNFRNSIVFAKVRTDEQVTKLKEIADIVEESFLDQEIVSTEKSGSFKPHITVMKLTRDKSFRKKGGIRKIDESLYKQHVDADFGQQNVNTLQLCAMLKKKTKSGYYQVEHSVQFGPDFSEETVSVETGSENKTAPDSKKSDAVWDVRDKDAEHIRMLVDELIERVVESESGKSEMIVENAAILESDKMDEMESTDISNEIAHEVNCDKTASQTELITDTVYEDSHIDDKMTTASPDEEGLKFQATVTLINKADTSESPMKTDLNKFCQNSDINSDICISPCESGNPSDDIAVPLQGACDADIESNMKVTAEAIKAVKNEPSISVITDNLRNDNVVIHKEAVSVETEVIGFSASELFNKVVKEDVDNIELSKPDSEIQEIVDRNTSEECSTEGPETDLKADKVEENCDLHEEPKVCSKFSETDVSNIPHKLEDSGVGSELNISAENDSLVAKFGPENSKK